MIFNLFVFISLALAWTATLWFAFAFDFTAWQPGSMAAVHVLPPAFAWAAWLVMRRRVQEKRAAEAQAREDAAQAERKAARESARKKYDEEMQHRRFGCDCRMAVFSRLGLMAPLPLAEQSRPNVDIRPCHLNKQEREHDVQLQDDFMPAIEEALSAIYASCRASAAFPLFLQPPADIPGEELIARLRAIQSQLALKHAPELQSGDARPPILFLPAGDCASNSLVSLFETAPDLPGAIVLAFDSPFSRADREHLVFDGDIDPDPAQRAREQYAGKPSEAVIALLMTNAELCSMLAEIAHAAQSSGEDSMTPYWEKAMRTGGHLAALSRLSGELREELAELPVLGRMHRAAIRQLDGGTRSGVLEAARVMQDVLEQAQINAGLINPPFTHIDVAEEDKTPPSSKHEKSRCGAIVHNAGSVDIAGKRLAALGNALYYFDIDLSPVDNELAINVVSRIGDMGRAAGMGQVALGFVCAAVHEAPTLCVEFQGNERMTASFVMPVSSPLAQAKQDDA